MSAGLVIHLSMHNPNGDLGIWVIAGWVTW